MMAWRSETVMTFHIEPNPASMPNANQATGQLEVSASADRPDRSADHRQGQRRTGPDRLAHPWCGEASTMPPMAPPVVRNANVRADVPSTSWPNSTKVAAVIIPMAFRKPRMIAIGHSSE